jgi:hypothetical protein
MSASFWPSRRSLLAGLGGTAAILATPFPHTRGAEARAAALPAKRLVILYGGNGTIRDAWLPVTDPVLPPGGSTSDFTLGPILAPLAPFQDILTVVDGIQIYGGGPAGNPHHLGFGCSLTGVDLVEGEYLDNQGRVFGSHGGPTLDQVVADALLAPTPYRSLELGVQSGLYNGDTSMSKLSARGPAQLLPPDIDPYHVFDRVFGGSLSPEELAKVRSEQASVLDFAYQDLARIKPKLALEEQARLDIQLESVRAVETRLQTVGPECSPPDPGVPLDIWDNDNFPVLVQLQLELLSAALACDQTRVATFMFSEAASQTVYRWLGMTSTHHDLSHMGDSDKVAQGSLVAINAWIASQVASLATLLQAVPDGGGTLLDSSLLMWSNDLGIGNIHSLTQVPFTLVGTAGGAIPGGKLGSFPDRYQNDLLLAVAQAMGVDIDVFGAPEANAGPLAL